MKIELKTISLKKDTLEDINNGDINTDKYIQYIRNSLNNANAIINTKLQGLEGLELYELLSKVFNIELEESEVLRVLKEKYDKHYTKITKLKTNMVDKNGNNIALVGASTKNVAFNNQNITLKNLKKLINSYDYLVLKEEYYVPDIDIEKPDKYECFKPIKINSKFDNQDDLFVEKINLLKKEIKNPTLLKKILYLVEKYVKELIYQAKGIIRLAEEDESKEEICLQYKKEFEANFLKKDIFIKGTHKKSY